MRGKALLGLLVGALLLLGFVVGALVREPQNSLWIPVVAALGASALTTLAAFGVEAYRQQVSAATGRSERRRLAYNGFLVRSAEHISMLQQLRELRRLGTQPRLKINLDAVQTLREYMRELLPMFEAWTQVWMVGSQAAIEASNRFIDDTIPTTAAATTKGSARPAVVSWILGEAWTSDQENELKEQLRTLGRQRIQFARLAREELGEDAADILAGIPQQLHET